MAIAFSKSVKAGEVKVKQEQEESVSSTGHTTADADDGIPF